MDDHRHPYFDDHRSIAWQTTLAAGLAVASRDDKRVFIQLGRPSCGGTRALIEKTIWKDEIADYVNHHFVPIAINLDDGDPDVAALLARLPKREPTPLCVYLASDGRLLHSTAGGRPAAVFLQDLVQAIGKK